VIGAVLAAGGTLLGRLIAPVWADARRTQPALQLDVSVAAAGQGVTLALLGGFRALVADLVWLRMYTLWETRDPAAVETLIRLVATIDPRPVYFWLNGSRILAYDVPTWRIEVAGGFERVPEPMQTRIAHEQAAQAIRHLEQGMRVHPQSAELWVERANIELNRLQDMAAAARSYRQAWEMPRGPFFAARLHGELLRRMGRKAEALAWLKELHPKLPPGDDAAAADVVLGRIRDLERELGVDPLRTFQSHRP
jgi:hypothetical protein